MTATECEIKILPMPPLGTPPEPKPIGRRDRLPGEVPTSAGKVFYQNAGLPCRPDGSLVAPWIRASAASAGMVTPI